MRRILQPLLLLLAGSTDKELARQVQFLKVENQILRSKLPKRITVTAAERQRLLKFGRAVGRGINHLISIVTPRTFARWLSADKESSRQSPAKLGRPKTDEEVRQLVIRLARENRWGSARILGELKKLGVRKICRSTVRNILKANGFDPGPYLGETTWDEFLKIHAKTLWACDFFSKRIWTMKGRVDGYVLFFLHLGSRRVFVTPSTVQPDRVWMAQQARNVSMHFADQPDKPKILIRDHDGKFSPEFDAILESEDITVKKVGPLAPNLNAFAERWVQSIKRECLDHFIVLGERHLDHLIREYLAYYHTERPHQGLDNRPLTLVEPGENSAGEIVCSERLGGLLKHYYRKAG